MKNIIYGITFFLVSFSCFGFNRGSIQGYGLDALRYVHGSSIPNLNESCAPTTSDGCALTGDNVLGINEICLAMETTEDVLANGSCSSGLESVSQLISNPTIEGNSAVRDFWRGLDEDLESTCACHGENYNSLNDDDKDIVSKNAKLYSCAILDKTIALRKKKLENKYAEALVKLMNSSSFLNTYFQGQRNLVTGRGAGSAVDKMQCFPENLQKVIEKISSKNSCNSSKLYSSIENVFNNSDMRGSDLREGSRGENASFGGLSNYCERGFMEGTDVNEVFDDCLHFDQEIFSAEENNGKYVAVKGSGRNQNRNIYMMTEDRAQDILSGRGLAYSLQGTIDSAFPRGIRNNFFTMDGNQNFSTNFRESLTNNEDSGYTPTSVDYSSFNTQARDGRLDYNSKIETEFIKVRSNEEESDAGNTERIEELMSMFLYSVMKGSDFDEVRFSSSLRDMGSRINENEDIQKLMLSFCNNKVFTNNMIDNCVPELNEEGESVVKNIEWNTEFLDRAASDIIQTKGRVQENDVGQILLKRKSPFSGTIPYVLKSVDKAISENAEKGFEDCREAIKTIEDICKEEELVHDDEITELELITTHQMMSDFEGVNFEGAVDINMLMCASSSHKPVLEKSKLLEILIPTISGNRTESINCSGGEYIDEYKNKYDIDINPSVPLTRKTKNADNPDQIVRAIYRMSDASEDGINCFEDNDLTMEECFYRKMTEDANEQIEDSNNDLLDMSVPANGVANTAGSESSYSSSNFNTNTIAEQVRNQYSSEGQASDSNNMSNSQLNDFSGSSTALPYDAAISDGRSIASTSDPESITTTSGTDSSPNSSSTSAAASVMGISQSITSPVSNTMALGYLDNIVTPPPVIDVSQFGSLDSGSLSEIETKHNQELSESLEKIREIAAENPENSELQEELRQLEEQIVQEQARFGQQIAEAKQEAITREETSRVSNETGESPAAVGVRNAIERFPQVVEVESVARVPAAAYDDNTHGEAIVSLNSEASTLESVQDELLLMLVASGRVAEMSTLSELSSIEDAIKRGVPIDSLLASGSRELLESFKTEYDAVLIEGKFYRIEDLLNGQVRPMGEVDENSEGLSDNATAFIKDVKSSSSQTRVFTADEISATASDL